MPPAKAKDEGNADRVSILNTVKTPLGFFVLVVLVVEAVLGRLAAEGPNQLTALYGMFFFLAVLTGVVAFFAYQQPEALRGKRATDEGMAQLRQFSSKISGYWWETIQPADSSALSTVEISPDSVTETVKMKGRSYTSAGEPAAIWESVATCMNPSERRVFYYWKGWHPARPNEPYEGFGEISFYESLDDAVGIFSDTNLTDWKTTTRKSVTLKRSTAQEGQVLAAADEKPVRSLVKTKLGLTA